MKKIKSIDCIILIFISSFIIFDFSRRAIICNWLNINSNLLGYLNYIFYILLFFVMTIKLKYNMYDIKMLYLILCAQVLFLINYKINNYSFDRYIFEQVFVLLPIFLVGIKLNQDDFKRIFKIFILGINILVMLIIILGIIDFITNFGVQKYLASKNYFESSLNLELLNPLGVYRYFSFYGHPLRVAQMIVLFYIINSIYYIYYDGKVNMLLITILSMVGIILTSSKAGIIILLVLIIFNSKIYKSNTQKIFINTSILCVVLTIISTDIFKNVVLARMVGIDFSSGRNDIFNYIKSGYIEWPSILGKGVDYSGYLLSTVITTISSFEYPFIIISYDCGILIAFIFIICVSYPIVNMIQRKQYKIAIYFIAISGIIHIYNGITVMGDYMIQYCFIVMIFSNLSKYLEGENEKSTIFNR